MKASINENGNLKITAETPLESYSLDKWYDGYSNDGIETLTIERMDPTTDTELIKS